MATNRQYEAVVIGTSAGGFKALSSILTGLPASYPIPILVVQHRAKYHRDVLEELLQVKSKITIKQADEKEPAVSQHVYIAPPDYHLLVERDRTLSLSSDTFVKFSRPSIDVLFQSAARVYKQKLVGIILTGASNDGAAGVETIYQYGGTTIAQLPDEADFPFMPKASIATGKVHHIWSILEIQNFLLQITNS